MARQTLTKTTAPGNYSDSGVDVTLTTADTSNDDQFLASGSDLVIAVNTGASPATVTINSVADEYGRTGDVSAYSVGAGETAVFGPFPTHGWAQSDGYVYLEASSTDIDFGVVILPK